LEVDLFTTRDERIKRANLGLVVRLADGRSARYLRHGRAL
jgi:hypothetical protein